MRADWKAHIRADHSPLLQVIDQLQAFLECSGKRGISKVRVSCCKEFETSCVHQETNAWNLILFLFLSASFHINIISRGLN